MNRPIVRLAIDSVCSVKFIIVILYFDVKLLTNNFHTIDSP
ncbi:hypothetical protein GPUN_1201 [Glaciecola punicea ACAM 611]|uniref:Uncharacterized protein n=1 Tax=Glaciecola punicea ACAM 611 TaxID=1121923 RepID=H5TAJ8_9ALTE|nr:hypothetical protein GPUN_1201 [Glaciecola punicea ACAM 611]